MSYSVLPQALEKLRTLPLSSPSRPPIPPSTSSTTPPTPAPPKLPGRPRRRVISQAIAPTQGVRETPPPGSDTERENHPDEQLVPLTPGSHSQAMPPQDRKGTEENARTLRELLKYPDNKICADCKRPGTSCPAPNRLSPTRIASSALGFVESVSFATRSSSHLISLL